MKKKFFDRITLKLTSGNGGNGSQSLRREKYVPKGGPDGGDGGDGGDVVIRANKTLTDFSHLARKRSYRGEDGVNGMKRKKSGPRGKDFLLEVPLGTLIKTAAGVTIAELTRHGAQILALHGGKGGKGNVHYKSSVRQKPLKFQMGSTGSSAELYFELLTIAQIALIGAPNAGKSTLLSKITDSLGKIANYPFTTLTPQLGVYRFPSHYRHPITFAEIPGLVEGASEGLGLGHHFLRHARKASYYFFLIDSSSKDPLDDFNNLRKEVITYEKQLGEKPFLVLFTKCELISSTKGKQLLQKSNALLQQISKHPNSAETLLISCHNNLGFDALEKSIERISTQGFSKAPSTRFLELDELLKKI